MDQAPGSPHNPADHGPHSGPGAQGLPTCYRHPDRQTGVRCTRCERPICPECMVDASVGFQCPECVRTGSGTGHTPSASRPRTLAGGTLTADGALVTKVLIGLNVAFFILQRILGDNFTNRFELLGRATYSEYGPLQGIAEGQYYRLLTAMFLHAGFAHILFNMLSLWWIGAPLERVLGRGRYLALYLLSGLLGSALGYLLASPLQPSVGASGAIYGLFGAIAVIYRRLRYDMRPVLILLAINLIFTFTVPGIGWQAHVGGLAGGVAICYAMVHAPREHRALAQYGACALVLATIVVMTLARTAQLT